ncbi:MAG: hypothetical protein HRU13_00195 [Phycisphaerales bacterium]|nr:hypothetical protein [Phycisphaerales bacterium]
MLNSPTTELHRPSILVSGTAMALAAAAALSGCASVTPAPASPAIAFLEGDWVGELEYLDYQDNTSTVTLPMTVSFVSDGPESVMGSYVYTEPDGSTVPSEGPIAITDGSLVIGDAGLPIVDFTLTGDPAAHEIISEGSGEDAGKAATVRVELLHAFGDAGETVTLTKWIQPGDGGERYWRNRYSLRRR